MKTRLFVLIVTMCALMAAGCGIKNAIVRKPMNTPVIQVAELNPNISSAKLKNVIVAACTKYGWRVDSSTPSSVTATLIHNTKESVTVDIAYSPAQVSINYVRSSNMREEGGKIHRAYNRWVKNLEFEIRNQIIAAKG